MNRGVLLTCLLLGTIVYRGLIPRRRNGGMLGKKIPVPTPSSMAGLSVDEVLELDRPFKFQRPSRSTFFGTKWNNDTEAFKWRSRSTQTTPFHIPPQALIKFLARDLKDSFKIKEPKDVIFIKTGCFKELGPYDRDWFFTRAAAVFRQTYIAKKGWMTVGRLRRHFGGNQNMGHRPWHKRKAAGGNIRKAFQELVIIGMLEKNPTGRGHRCTKKGKKYLEKLARKVAKMLPPLMFERKPGDLISPEWCLDYDDAKSRLISPQLWPMDFDTWDEDRDLRTPKKSWDPNRNVWKTPTKPPQNPVILSPSEVEVSATPTGKGEGKGKGKGAKLWNGQTSAQLLEEFQAWRAERNKPYDRVKDL